ncbi:unnamed protein product [Paramecium sonneborni]|uniref:Uncharacterized protein n=1 Tax=Paramecium sonneborni TaxID=65129 RepID=A0A8S1JTX1_9CILI|nr:unnamed protein product [Paramecium sonneborni]
MIPLQCSQHEQEEQKYICVHPICLKKVNNKLCCIQQIESTQIYEYFRSGKKAFTNSYILKKQLEEEILKNQDLQNKFENRLMEVLNSIVSWQNNQKKIFKNIADDSNRILIEYQMMATNLEKNPSLDSLIYFYQQNIEENQAEYSNIREQMRRYLDYQMKEIEQKRDILITQKTLFQRDILKFNYLDNKIQFNCFDDQEFEICQKHSNKIKMLCTHLNCLSNQPLQLLCKNCVAVEHQEHYTQKYVKNISSILKEQAEKTELIEKLKKKYSLDIQEQTEKNLQKISEKLASLYQNFENQKDSKNLNSKLYFEQHRLEPSQNYK